MRAAVFESSELLSQFNFTHLTTSHENSLYTVRGVSGLERERERERERDLKC